MLAVDSVNVLETLAGASGGVAATSAVTRPVVLTKGVLLTWSRPQVTSEREPGKLLASGLQQIKKFLEVRTRVAVMSWPLVFCRQYLTSVFRGAHPQSSMSLRNRRELRTAAECIDALLVGDLPHLADLAHVPPDGGSNGSG